MCRKLIYLFPFVLVLGLAGNAAGQIATNPIPANGGEIDQTWVALGWVAGAGAVSHDLYLGDNFADVDDGTGSTFRGNVAVTTFLVGFVGSPYPEGLIQGTTYYWRVDEVQADATVVKGQVWSFTYIGPTARHPSPADGARFIDLDATLSWSPGSGAVMHYVYFGDNQADVDAGTGGTDKGVAMTTTFDPGALTSATTYYWRIDEFDGTATHKGDIWSFRTRPAFAVLDPHLVGWWKLDDEGTGTAIDYSGNNRDGTLHGDPQWVPGVDGDALEFDGDDYVTIDGFKGVVGDGTETPPFSITAWVRLDSPTGSNGEIVGWGSTGAGNRLEFRFNSGNNRVRIESGGGNIQGDVALTTGQWTHVAVTLEANSTYTSDTGVNFYFDGLLVNRPNSDNDPIHPISNFDVIFGQRYNQSNSRWFIGALDDIRIYDKAITAEEAGRAMLGDPRLAWAPVPADQSEPFIEEATPLSWTPGDSTAQHDVYLGVSELAVLDADISDTTGIYRGRQDANSYTPPDTLEFGETYFWRIDEIEADGTTMYRGRVWSFTIADFIVVDDFESYNDLDPANPESNRIFLTWIDGFENPLNGATVGYFEPPFVETAVVNSGAQAMPYFYDNSVGNSEATMTLTSVRDWTKHGVKALSLWFQGNPASVGSFTQGPGDTHTLNVRSGNIAGTSDEFHFAYQELTGAGTIIAKVERVQRTHNAAQAGVMIRDTLDSNSAHATVVVQPRGGGAFLRRATTVDGTTTTADAAMAAPLWVKVERDIAGNVMGSYSADGITWTQLGGEVINFSTPLYIGLVVASNHATRTCEAIFSDVQITGAGGQWANQDIGILANDPAPPMYVALANSGGAPAVVYHEDPDAAQTDTWTQWNIDAKAFADQGVNLANVDSISIGFGDKANPQPGGAGKMYFDDIRLYRPRCMLELLQPAGDFNGDCIVDYMDLETMAADWLESDSVVPTATADPAGLMAHYKLDGDATDSSGNNYHGSEKGGPTYVEGKFGQALSFDGFDDYVALDVNYASTGHTEITVCAWFRTTNSANQHIASFDRDEYWRLGMTEYVSTGGLGWHVMTMVGGTETQMDYGSVTRVDDGQWHHAAGTFNNGTLSIYVDGGLETTAIGGPTFGTGLVRWGYLGIGSESQDMFNGMTNATGYFDGELDDVRIYSRALSSDEIAHLADDTPGDGELYVPVVSVANVSNEEAPLSRSVNFKDFALLVDGWLDEQLWPGP
ncbi:MAG: LamG domain-containing protein [Planctomycetota bacterium]|jgi:hypothetical protein